MLTFFLKNNFLIFSNFFFFFIMPLIFEPGPRSIFPRSTAVSCCYAGLRDATVFFPSAGRRGLSVPLYSPDNPGLFLFINVCFYIFYCEAPLLEYHLSSPVIIITIINNIITLKKKNKRKKKAPTVVPVFAAWWSR